MTKRALKILWDSHTPQDFQSTPFFEIMHEESTQIKLSFLDQI